MMSAYFTFASIIDVTLGTLLMFAGKMFTPTSTTIWRTGIRYDVFYDNQQTC